ncbi:related to Zn(II)2Cys6 transcriptional activator [Rhynchosporium secalis]|uniref:Related to Zn(II)2Cys6 transcriptional activator n=1 Tax=Rhynchosporium secalis TaxID=38038 RepID=A0A1E1MPE3_RHYSE|nr:related to Zn(II)2Cys6 transcriptional activator [Rhynchosporium secalis]
MATPENRGKRPKSTSHSDDNSGYITFSLADKGKREWQGGDFISCVTCQARKVKCDRVRPNCGWCEKNGRQCSYSKKQRPGPKPGSSQDLADKVFRLENVVQLLSKQLENHICVQKSIETSSDASHSPHGQESSTSSGPVAPRSSAAEDENRIPWLSQVTLSEQTLPNQVVRDTTPKYRNETYVRAFTPVTPLVTPSLSTTVGWPSETVEPELPPPEQLYVLVDLYFKHINTWVPMLDRLTTFDILSQTWIPNESDRVLLHAIVLVSLRFSQDPGHTAEVRNMYRIQLKRRVQLFGLEHSNIRTIQSMVLLTVDMLGTSHSPETSNMVALITQSILNFRLGFEVGHSVGASSQAPSTAIRSRLLNPPISWIENEERRRLFWVVYSMDRYTTLGTYSRFAIDEKTARRRLPCRYDLFSEDRHVETRWPRWDDSHDHVEEDTVQNAANLGSYSYHCELLKIMSQTHEFLEVPLNIDSQHDINNWRSRYSELDQNLSIWLRSLPGEYSEISQFCHSDTKSKISNWIILQTAFVVAVIHLHAPVAYPSESSALFRPSYDAMQKCLGAVASLKELTLDVVNTDMLDLLGPGFALAMWIAIRLLLIHASVESHILDSNIFFFMDTLRQLGKYWPVATRYWELLDPLIRETNPAVATRVSEMRRSAYSLQWSLYEDGNARGSVSSRGELTSDELLSLDIFGTFNYPYVQSRRPALSLQSLPRIEAFDRSDPRHDWSPR